MKLSRSQSFRILAGQGGSGNLLRGYQASGIGLGAFGSVQSPNDGSSLGILYNGYRFSGIWTDTSVPQIVVSFRTPDGLADPPPATNFWTQIIINGIVLPVSTGSYATTTLGRASWTYAGGNLGLVVGNTYDMLIS